MRSIDDLSESEHLFLVADLLEFFRVTSERQGRPKTHLRDAGMNIDIDNLYGLVDSLVDSGQLWRRGDGPNTIYATTTIGIDNIPKYRKEARE